MFKEFESGIKNNASEDYWYDEGLYYYQDMLDDFTDEEWEELSEKVDYYDDEAQMRCVECLSGTDNRNSLAIILRLSDTNNRELFVTCVDSMRDMDISSLSDSEKEHLAQRVKEFSPEASSLESIVLNAFLKYIGYEG